MFMQAKVPRYSHSSGCIHIPSALFIAPVWPPCTWHRRTTHTVLLQARPPCCTVCQDLHCAREQTWATGVARPSSNDTLVMASWMACPRSAPAMLQGVP